MQRIFESTKKLFETIPCFDKNVSSFSIDNVIVSFSFLIFGLKPYYDVFKMKLSEVVVDKIAVPTQQELQIVNSIFDGVEKQKNVPVKQPSNSNKNILLTTVVVGVIIAVLLGLQPSLNNLFSKLRSFPSFLSIFVQVIFSMIVFYFISKLFIR